MCCLRACVWLRNSRFCEEEYLSAPEVPQVCDFLACKLLMARKNILVQYSDKFMLSVVLHSIVLRRSQSHCIVNLFYVDIIQNNAMHKFVGVLVNPVSGKIYAHFGIARNLFILLQKCYDNRCFTSVLMSPAPMNEDSEETMVGWPFFKHDNFDRFDTRDG